MASSAYGWAGPILDSAQALVGTGQVQLMMVESQGARMPPGRSKGKTIAWATVAAVGLLMVAAPGDTCDGIQSGNRCLGKVSRDTGVMGLGAIVAGLGMAGLSWWSD
jgi:hypothetical protein